MIRKPYHYHNFWKGLNQDPKDHRTRWNDDYVFVKEWYVTPICFSHLPILLAPIIPLLLLSTIVPYLPKFEASIWVFTIPFLISYCVWVTMAIWKILPYLLKRYEIIVYAPKGVPMK